MSRKEAPRAGLFKAAVAGQISNAQAARALQLSERQVQRLKARYRVEGAAGLPHRSRGRPSTRGLPAALTQQVRALLQTTYRDVNDCHAPGKLREVDGLRVSQGAAFSKDGGSGHGPTAAPRRGTAGQASPPAGAVPRARRTPEARMGALVQLDASLFD